MFNWDLFAIVVLCIVVEKSIQSGRKAKIALPTVKWTQNSNEISFNKKLSLLKT